MYDILENRYIPVNRCCGAVFVDVETRSENNYIAFCRSIIIQISCRGNQITTHTVCFANVIITT